MEQLSFFEESGQSAGLPEDYLDYRPGLFTKAESDFYLNKFIAEAPWKQPLIKMYDKQVLSPRLTAWYGVTEAGSPLTKKISDALLWTPELLTIKSKIEPLAGMVFNSVLLNYYRNGNDSVAWHSDKESGPDTVVASVSFGQVRAFDIRNKKNHAEKYSVRLQPGSYLLMKPGFQIYWEHRIAKYAGPMKARVNLTFRVIR